MLVKGDKIRLIQPMGAFTNVGEVCEVISNVDGVINFKFGHGMHMGCMSYDEFEKYFEKYEDKNINVGDYVRMIKNTAWLYPMKVDDQCVVKEIFDTLVTLYCEYCNRYYNIPIEFFHNYFEKVVYFENSESEEDEPISVNFEYIEELLDNSQINISTVFDKCTVVACKLPNGFVIVESSACIDPRNYDKELGVDICMSRITDKIWEMEAYKTQTELWEAKEEFEELEEFEDKEDYCDKVENCSDCEYCADNGGICTDCQEEDEEDYDHIDNFDEVYEDCENCPLNGQCHP